MTWQSDYEPGDPVDQAASTAANIDPTVVTLTAEEHQELIRKLDQARDIAARLESENAALRGTA